MGILDFLFPACDHRNISHENLPVSVHPASPESGNCVNCHSTPPAQSSCPVQLAWPAELYNIIPALRNHPQQNRWWQENNHLATWIAHQRQQHTLPIDLRDIHLNMEVKPDEAQLEGAASWLLTEDSVITGGIRGNNLRLLLNRGNLLEVSDTLLGGLGLYFDHGLTTNSCLLNFFRDFNNDVVANLPVAYDPQSHRVYSLGEYIRHYYTTFPADPHLYQDAAGRPYYAENQEAIYEGLSARARNGLIAIISSNRGGEAWNLLRRDAAPLVRFPYLFEMAVGFTTRQAEVGEIDLARLFPELMQALAMTPSSSSGVGSGVVWESLRRVLSLTQYISFNAQIHPQRFFWDNFDIEFNPETNIEIGLRTRGSELRNVTSRSHVALHHLFIPGWLRMGASSFDLEGHGPNLNLNLRNLDLHLEDFEWGASDLAHRGMFHVSRGNITDGTVVDYEQGEIVPGVAVRGDLQRGLRLSANFNLNATVTHQNQEYSLSGQVLAAGRLQNLEWEVGRTFIQLKNFTFQRSGDAPLFENATLTMTDMPERLGQERRGFLLSLDIPLQHIPYLEHYRSVHLEAFVPLQTYHAQDGNWAGFLNSFISGSSHPNPLNLRNRFSFDVPVFSSQRGTVRVLPLQGSSESFEQLLGPRSSSNEVGSESPFVRLLPPNVPIDFLENPENVTEHLSDERYDWNSLLRDFDTRFAISLQGRSGVPNLEGELQLKSRQEGACQRSYEVSSELSQLSTLLGPQLELILRQVHLMFAARHSLESGAVQQFEIPQIDLSANTRSAPHQGLVQGPLHIQQQNQGGRVPLRMTYDPQAARTGHEQVQVRDLRLRFSGEDIRHPALVNSSRDSQGHPQVTGLDIRGLLRTDRWTQDQTARRGSGLVCLRGSPQGDVFLRDAQHHRISTPFLENSLWCAMQVNRYDPLHQVLYGSFLLNLGIDLSLARHYGYEINASGSTGLYSDNLPVSAGGYRWIQQSFLNRLQRQRNAASPQPSTTSNFPLLVPFSLSFPRFSLQLEPLSNPSLDSTPPPSTPISVRDLMHIPLTSPGNPLNETPSSVMIGPPVRSRPAYVYPRGQMPVWGDVVLNVLNLLSSADITVRVPTNRRLDANGREISDEASCRYNEFVSVNQCDPGSRSTCFPAHTSTTARVEVRETVDTHESIIHRVLFAFSHPARILNGGTAPLNNIPLMPPNAVALNTRGFRTVPPFVAGARPMEEVVRQMGVNGNGTTLLEEGRTVPLGTQVLRPPHQYYQLQYFFENGYPSPHLLQNDVLTGRVTGNPFVNNQLTESLLTYTFPLERGGTVSAPYDRLMSIFATQREGSLIAGFLESFGLNHPGLYPNGVPVGALPVTTQGFVDLIRPLFDSISRRHLQNLIQTYNPNTEVNERCQNPAAGRSRLLDIHPSNPLFDWTHIETAQIEALFRPDVFRLPENMGVLHFANSDHVRTWIREAEAQLSNVNVNEEQRRILRARISEQREWLNQYSEMRINHLSVQSGAQRLFAQISGLALDSAELEFIVQEGNAPTRVTLHHVTADSLSIEFPPLSELLELKPEEIMLHAQIHIRGLRADELRIANPQFHVNVVLQGVNFAHAWMNTPHVDLVSRRMPLHVESGSVRQVELSVDELGTVTTRNARIQNLEYIQESNQAHLNIGNIQWGGDLRFHQDGVDVSLAGGSQLRNLVLGVSTLNNSIGNASIDFDAEGSITSGHIRLAPVQLEIDHLNISDGHFQGESILRSVSSQERDFNANIRGNLSLLFNTRLQTNLNIPGFYVNGNLQDTTLEGPANIRLHLGESNSWSVERGSSASPQVLRLYGTLADTEVTHDPSQSDAELRTVRNHEAVETRAQHVNAQFQIEDLIRLASGPLELDFRRVQVDHIEGSGEIWAAIPLFGYMRAIMAMGNGTVPLQAVRPRVAMPNGASCQDIPGGVPAPIHADQGETGNFIYIDRWQTGFDPSQNALQSLFNGFRSCVLSQPLDLTGIHPHLSLGIPQMTINPNRLPHVQSHNLPLYIDAAWMDHVRGGWMYFSTRHRALSLPSYFPRWTRE